MGSVSFVYTVTGAETLGATFYFNAIQNWTGAYTVDFVLSTPATGIVNLIYKLYRSGDSTNCLQDGTSIFSGATTSHESWTVGVPSGSWGCTNWDSVSVGYHSATNRMPTGATLTVTFTGDGITTSTGICAYGSEAIDPGIKVVDLIPTAIAILRRDTNKWWALAGLLNAIAKPILLDYFCANPPPPDEDLVWTDFLPTGGLFAETVASRKLRQKAEREIWSIYCHCKPATGGGPPPNGPGTTNWIQPTFYITNDHRTISNYDISTTLQWIYNFQLTNQYTTNNTYNDSHDQSITIGDTSTTVNQLAEGMCPPAEFELGTVHADLLGAGRIAISDQVVGFRVDVIDRNMSEITLSGQPMYLWNMGWISILGDGDAMVDEKRVTREGYLWFPCGIRHATEFAYTLREFTRCTVTELVKP